MRPKTLIPKQTTASSANFICSSNAIRLPATIVCNNLAGTETVAILISSDGLTYSPLMVTTGVPEVLTATRNAVAINSPGYYSLIKPVTVALVDIGISSYYYA